MAEALATVLKPGRVKAGRIGIGAQPIGRWRLLTPGGVLITTRVSTITTRVA
jgi:hypothetical protein